MTTVKELIKKNESLLNLLVRLEEQRDLTIDGGTAKIDRDDLIECINCVEDYLELIGKAKVDF